MDEPHRQNNLPPHPPQNLHNMILMTAIAEFWIGNVEETSKKVKSFAYEDFLF